MPLLHQNFPDEIWAALKAWAKVIAQGPETPTLDECSACVERVAKEITGIPNLLRPDVIAFYAAETCDMIAMFRNERAVAADGSAGQVV